MSFHFNFSNCVFGGGSKFSQVGLKTAIKFDPMGLIAIFGRGGGGGSNLVCMSGCVRLVLHIQITTMAAGPDYLVLHCQITTMAALL